MGLGVWGLGLHGVQGFRGLGPWGFMGFSNNLRITGPTTLFQFRVAYISPVRGIVSKVVSPRMLERTRAL